MEMQAAVIGKLRQDLSSSQHVQATTAEQMRKLEIDKIASRKSEGRSAGTTGGSRQTRNESSKLF